MTGNKATCMLAIVAVCALCWAPGCSKKKDSTQTPKNETSASAPALEVWIESDKKTVTATGKNGKKKWSVDVIGICGAPAVGSPVVRHTEVRKGGVHVIYGKHTAANIDLKTGKVKCLGAD